MNQACLLLAVLTFTSVSLAQREPVLKQIDHPHNYYFREMYLSQLTSAPSAVAWSPDSKEVIYSMAGSLWRQAIDSTSAIELTHGPGYDYQPDWSPDGRYVVYTKYHQDAMELWLLDLETKHSRQLTKEGAVNLEPRWSPDGTRIAYVSTAYNRHFHIFQLQFKDGQPQSIERLTGETITTAKRYYYSQADHEISPTWSPDGKELIFIYNRDRIYGTGGLWRMEAKPGAQPRLIHYEETTWRARPDWSPDGRRVVFSSYDRRQWHQLWMTTSDGGDPVALTYGEYDNTNARWSRDGKRIAFISNRSGNTELWLVDTVGGFQRKLETRLSSQGRKQLQITVLDPQGRRTAARVSVRDGDGRFCTPVDRSWLHADDSFVRAQMAEEPRYFHTDGSTPVSCRGDKAWIETAKGNAFALELREIPLNSANQDLKITLKSLPQLPSPGRWVSADVHVHMNYGGHYRNTPERMLKQAKAEDLNVVFNLIVNKEQRIPDIDYFSTKPDKFSTADHVLMHGQEFHTSNWGHVGLLGLKRNYLLPDYSSYPKTAAASYYPSNTVVADLAHEQGGLMGYVHPYEIEDMPDPSAARNHALPVDVALGKVDYLEVLGFSDHHKTAEVWYRLLNLGFHIPSAGGTDAMANYASLRGPVGTNRTYANLSAGPVDADKFLAELKAGRSFATNAPLLHFTLGKQGLGGELRLASAQEVPYTVAMRSIVPIDHLEIVCNGKVAKDLNVEGKRQVADLHGTLPVEQSGWCVLRAWSEKAAYPVLDIYPYGTTSPIYVSVAGAAQKSSDDAAYFIKWIDNIIARVSSSGEWNTSEERESVLKSLARARAVYAAKQ